MARYWKRATRRVVAVHRDTHRGKFFCIVRLSLSSLKVSMTLRKNLVEMLESRRLLTTAFAIQFNDPTNAYLPYHDEIQSTLLAAGAEWASKIVGTGTIDLQVDFDPSVPTA